MKDDHPNRNIRLPKGKESGTFKTTAPALAYAKAALSDLHTDEVWTLAERLDDAMEKVVEIFVAEIRK